MCRSGFCSFWWLLVGRIIGVFFFFFTDNFNVFPVCYSLSMTKKRVTSWPVCIFSTQSQKRFATSNYHCLCLRYYTAGDKTFHKRHKMTLWKPGTTNRNYLNRQNFILKLIILGNVPALGFFLIFKIHNQINRNHSYIWVWTVQGLV